MLRPGFNVTALIVVFLGVVAMVVNRSKQYIPPPPANRLVNMDDAFLQMAAYQPINWMPLDDAALAQSRREAKPILLFIGLPWSATARGLDRSLFDDDEVANYLGRNYVCTRIDGNEYPEWLNAMLPISRVELDIEIDAQLWVLNSSGVPIQYLGRTRETPKLDYEGVAARLRQGVTAYLEDLERKEATPTQQANDFALAREPLSAWVTDDAVRTAARSAASTPGVRVAGRWMVQPGLVQFAIEQGDYARAESILMNWVGSPLFDPIRGGFWASARDSEPLRVTTDKVALPNAWLAAQLARVGTVRNNRVLLEAARLTYDAVRYSMYTGDGVASAILSDEDRRNRSDYASLTPKRMGQLPAATREWCAKFLQIDARERSNCVPSLKFPELLNDPMLRETREALVPVLGDRPRLVRQRYLYVEATVAARLAETARYLRDPVRLEAALVLVDRLNIFFSGELLSRRLSAEPTRSATLKDGLALADAYLEAFLASGRALTLRDGEALMAKLLRRWGTGDRFPLIADDQRGLIPNLEVPELVDHVGESTAATTVRLVGHYALILDRPEWRLRAGRAWGRWSTALNRTGVRSAGLYAARQWLGRDEATLIVGADPIRDAELARRRVPTLVYVPGIGPALGEHPDLGTGVYVRRIGTGKAPLVPKRP
ncbi:MAG: DUF255 domain-containing protein [Fimbriimonadaceae bacterium]|nr:DUF255 domain-containing protein [Fimbriimonadaceae bacterium]